MIKETLSLVLIASQTLILPAMAASTPESTLIENALALQGQNLSSQELQTQLSSIVGQYMRTADAKTEQQNLQEALVELGVYTPAQATSFVTDAETSAATLTAGSATSTEIGSQTIALELNRLMSLHPMGAQFSGCVSSDTVDLTGALGGLGVIIGLIDRFRTEECSSTYLGSTDIYDAYGNYLGSTDNYGPQVCTPVQNTPGENRAFDTVAIVGGVLVGISLLLQSAVCN